MDNVQNHPDQEKARRRHSLMAQEAQEQEQVRSADKDTADVRRQPQPGQAS